MTPHSSRVYAITLRKAHSFMAIHGLLWAQVRGAALTRPDTDSQIVVELIKVSQQAMADLQKNISLH